MKNLTVKSVKTQVDLDFAEGSKLSYLQLKTKYLGKNGIIKTLLKKIGNIATSKRANYGKDVNELKGKIDGLLEEKKKSELRKKKGSSMIDEDFDITAPFAPNTPASKKPELFSTPGTLHPITSMNEKALGIFKSMGFHVTSSRQLDDDYNVFSALNIPEGHPARDLWDTFWTEEGFIPTTHTSAMQNRILKEQKPPIREVIVGRCFRNEATDASHEHSFYQIEGMYVDKDINLADLIGTLKHFMNAFYDKDVKYKLQPSYFPFVEPGLEFMVECMVCGQKGCPFCSYTGWIELVPCGPIHPNVLREGGLDPNLYSGFAWGLGLDRLVMLAGQIEDIRHLHSGDLRFLTQFR